MIERNFEYAMRWYVENEWWWRKIKTGEYLDFYKQQYEDRLAKAGE
jgi:dTDP-glucose 4,6-dehydratase